MRAKRRIPKCLLWRLRANNWLILGIATGILLFISNATNNNAEAALQPVVATTSVKVVVKDKNPVRSESNKGTLKKETPVVLSASSTEVIVRAYFEDIPQLAEVSRCESEFHQTNKDGTIYRGEANPKDVGVMQINEFYHAETAKKLGFDIYTLEGNMAYARYIYEKQGIAPWSASAPCWNKKVSQINLVSNGLALNK